MIILLPHIFLLLLLLLFRGSAVMCRVQAGESLLKGGKCRDVRTPCKPPICTSWNICRTGTSHLKGVQQRADTTERSCLHRTHHLRWPVHLSLSAMVARRRKKHTITAFKTRCEAAYQHDDDFTSPTFFWCMTGKSCFPGSAVRSRGVGEQFFCAVSAL